MDDSLLIFHHIPKTAGTALRRMLAMNYPADGYMESYGPHRDSVEWYRNFYDGLTDREKNSLRCIAGHTAHFLIPVLQEARRPFRGCCLLRDPVERVVSLYYYVRRMADMKEGRGSATGREIVRRDWGLSDIYRNLGGGRENDSDLHELFKYFFNGQVRHLLAPHLDTGKLPYTATETADSGFYADSARDLLRRYYHVGTVEGYEESLMSLSREFGWREVKYEKINCNPERPAIPNLPGETASLIRAHNSLDIALHQDFVFRDDVHL